MNADTLAAAVAAVPREHYTDHPVHGSPPQTTAQATIERDILRAAREGDLTGRRILETGTGYTGALLTELAGPGGTVTSVDIDTRLVDRVEQAAAALEGALADAEAALGQPRADLSRPRWPRPRWSAPRSCGCARTSLRSSPGCKRPRPPSAPPCVMRSPRPTDPLPFFTGIRDRPGHGAIGLRGGSDRILALPHQGLASGA